MSTSASTTTHGFPPGIFIIGAAKSGTTSLANMLEQHPDICVSSPKEPDFFTRNQDQGLDWYKNGFNNVTDGMYLVDASTSYTSFSQEMIGSNTPEKIHQSCPNAKIIYIVRDPVQRTWSSYWHSVRAGEEKRPFLDAIKGQNLHIEGSMYFQWLERYLSYFDNKNIHVVNFHDFVKDNGKVFNDVLSFLEIENKKTTNTSTHATHKNESFVWNTKGQFILNAIGIHRIKRINKIVKKILPESLHSRIKNTLSSSTPKISTDEGKLLVPIFKDDVVKLKDLTGIDVRVGEWWN